jgi:uncharacterized membrane protein YdjX (TVP38/TMEM64 family)
MVRINLRRRQDTKGIVVGAKLLVLATVWFSLLLGLAHGFQLSKRSFLPSFRTCRQPFLTDRWSNKQEDVRADTPYKTDGITSLRAGKDNDSDNRKVESELMKQRLQNNRFGRTPRQVLEEEKPRLQIWADRRKQIRGCLRFSERIRNIKIAQGLIPEVDSATGKSKNDDGKLALSVTAFGVAAGAVLLRLGGRAALISTLGLDFVTDNPELQQQLQQILDTADSTNSLTKLGLFALAWTGVKVLCFDAGSVALALSSGLLFGGVIQGGVVSAACATLGSLVAFSLAKLDTPVRKQALQLLEEYPSLRGVEKVVSKDGIKAVLTLRLSPILPIPIGAYNYIFAVSSVPVLDFCGGIFLGSLKPYLLDSYLGYFGKEIIEANSASGSATEVAQMQDFILIVALGVSVLIGVFASQLASQTWDSVLEEVEAEKKAKALAAANAEAPMDPDCELTTQIFGVSLPDWSINLQRSWRDADQRISDMIAKEYNARVWNFTQSDNDPVPASLFDPARDDPECPERAEVYQGFDLLGSICDGLVLTPQLFAAFTKYSDPLYSGADDLQQANSIVSVDTVDIKEVVDWSLDPSRRRSLSLSEELESLTPTNVPAFSKINDDIEARMKLLRLSAEAKLATIDLQMKQRESLDVDASGRD